MNAPSPIPAMNVTGLHGPRLARAESVLREVQSITRGDPAFALFDALSLCLSCREFRELLTATAYAVEALHYPDRFGGDPDDMTATEDAAEALETALNEIADRLRAEARGADI